MKLWNALAKTKYTHDIIGLDRIITNYFTRFVTPKTCVYVWSVRMLQVGFLMIQEQLYELTRNRNTLYKFYTTMHFVWCYFQCGVITGFLCSNWNFARQIAQICKKISKCFDYIEWRREHFCSSSSSLLLFVLLN